jgi:predicted DNA-binding mobile mystery protein A
MDRHFRELQLHQTEVALAGWKDASLAKRPLPGWARAIRDALGMSLTAFARRLAMTPAGARKLEQAEAEDVITLASLRKLAEALDCELHYALVPRTSLSQHLAERAREVALERLRPVSHSMSLEDQTVQGRSREIQVELLIRELLDGPRRDLWR